MTMEAELYTLIGSVGFPIVMCLWFMARTEKVIREVTAALERLTDAVAFLQVGHNKRNI